MRTFLKVMLYLLVPQLLIMGGLSLAVAKSQIAWEGISGVLLLIAYFGAYRRTS